MRSFINEENIEMVEMPRDEFDCLLAKTKEEGYSTGILLRQKFEAASDLVSAAAKLLRL